VGDEADNVAKHTRTTAQVRGRERKRETVTK
jgi:hypothetical protein